MLPEEEPLLRTVELLLPEVLPLLRELELPGEELPVERLRLSCCAVVPEERLLPEEPVLPEEERTCEEEEEPELRVEELPEEVLPLLRELLWLEVDRVEPPPVERVWATISGAMSMARAIIMETAYVIILLIASQI